MCTFCRPLPRSSRETAETETLLRRPRQPLYPKKHRLLCPRAFQACIKTRSRSLTLPNYFMLLWFPWWLRLWGGCHGGFCRPHLPKVLRDWQCVLRFCICVKSSSCYSLVRLLPSSSSKSAPRPTVFDGFMISCIFNYLKHNVVDITNRALATVSRTFCQPHLPKVLRDR